MRYLALATDYDGTLADEGRVSKKALRALESLKESGRKLILVTGRHLPDLLRAFPEIEVFDRVVAENGALLYDPQTKQEKLLAQKADERLVSALTKRHVKPLYVGRSIVATTEPHQTTVIEVIHHLGLEHQVIFNKEAVMILPAGVNKETGLAAALKNLQLCEDNVVAIGDAENDHALLAHAGFAAAVANALPSLREEADWVSRKKEGAGVIELIGHLIKDDLKSLDRGSKRHSVSIGRDIDDKAFRIRPLDTCLLIAGPSGSGKTSITTSILEQIASKRFQFCIIDPEGDYERFPETVRLGDPDRPPSINEVMQLLERFENPVVNLLGVHLDDRPKFFASLLGRIQELRMRTGRPHFIVLDEAHHLFPTEWRHAAKAVPPALEGVALITVNPESISKTVLSKINLLIALGEEPLEILRRFAGVLDIKTPRKIKGKLHDGDSKLNVTIWAPTEKRHSAFQIHLKPGTIEHDRHQRKYAKGDMEEDSFYFRGAGRKLKLKAQNLLVFCQLAEGVDDRTWLHHLKQHDYSKWVRKAIDDAGLADRIERVEEGGLSARESRKKIIQLIAKTYTAAA